MPNSQLLDCFLRTRPALERFLRARGASGAEAEDILQDISLKVATDQVGPVSEPRAYLYKMAANQFLLHCRTEQRRARREGDWADARGGESRDVDPAASAEEQIIFQEELAILRMVLQRLPERTRTVFMRFRIEGEPQKQIALTLGISVSAVEKHLTRAYGEIARTKSALDADRVPSRHPRPKGARHGH